MSEYKKRVLRCRERCHINPRDFSLWDFAHAVVKARGENKFKLWTTTAAQQTCSSKSQVKRSAARLVGAGWFEFISKPTDGKFGAGVYRVVEHSEWVGKHGQKKCSVLDWNLPGADDALQAQTVQKVRKR